MSLCGVVWREYAMLGNCVVVVDIVSRSSSEGGLAFFRLREAMLDCALCMG